MVSHGHREAEVWGYSWSRIEWYLGAIMREENRRMARQIWVMRGIWWDPKQTADVLRRLESD